jgi:hypothetical protein
MSSLDVNHLFLDFNLGRGNIDLDIIFYVCVMAFSCVSHYLYWLVNKYLSYREQIPKLNKLKKYDQNSLLYLLRPQQLNMIKLELWVTSLSDTPRLQYYDVQTLEYRYTSKLSMKKERIWSNVKETTSHL